MADHEARVFQRQAELGLKPSDQNLAVRAVVAFRVRQVNAHTGRVPDRKRKLPTSQLTHTCAVLQPALHLWEKLARSSCMTRQSALAIPLASSVLQSGFIFVADHSVRAPGVRPSSCVPAASAADQMSFLMPLLGTFAAP